MKKLFTLTLIFLGFTAFSQKAVRVASFGGTDTISIMEQNIYKVDNESGDSTATIFYIYRGIASTVVADTNESFYLSNTSRLISLPKLGYTINADRIDGMGKDTDTTCFIFYLLGNQRIKVDLDTNLQTIQDTVNTL